MPRATACLSYRFREQPPEPDFDPARAPELPIRKLNATAGMSSRKPYTATGIGAKPVSPIQAVPTGTSDSQKSRWRLAHRVAPLIVLTACIR